MTAIDSAREVADAVLFEGYMLYPYRANDAKNRVRWQFGVLAPESFVEADPSERSWLQTDCLLEGHDPAVSVRVRFLQVQRRTVQAYGGGGFSPVDALDVDEATYLPWDEAVVHEFEVGVRVTDPPTDSEIEVPGGSDTEVLVTDAGDRMGRLVRVREPLDAVLHVECELMPGPYEVRRLRLQLRNQTQWHSIAGQGQRPDALTHSLIAAHLLVSVEGGAFVSQLDSPQWATGYVAACENVGVYPVLAGPHGSRALVLASPIILYDHPQVAPESRAAFCDATEMDEMLTLRTLTLTDEEKRQARGSDPRAAALIDHVEDLPPELLERLHGAIRSMTGTARREQPPEERLPWWDPGQDADVSPETDSLLVAGTTVRRGVQVRLRPGTRSADAQDMFLVGRTATVAAVFSDVDGGSHLAVTLDDLAEDGYNPHGRYLYFGPDEVEPLGAACEP